MRRDKADILQAKGIGFSKNRNILSWERVACDSTSVDTMKAPVRYAGAFNLEYGVKIVDASIENIVVDTVLFNYLPPNTVATYVRYIRMATLCIIEIALLLGSRG